MPVLDTNLLIRLDADDAAARRALEHVQDGPLVVPFQVALEYAAGKDDPRAAILAVAAAFVLDRPEAATLERAAHLASTARSKGHRVHASDAWIAAAAAVRDDYVVTTNKRHFKQLGVKAWHYEKEKAPPR